MATAALAVSAEAIAATPEFVATISRSYVPSATHSDVIELAKALAWPSVALIIPIILRKPLAEFLTTLGSRTSKISFFKLELELIAATPASSVPLLDDIRGAADSAEISDSFRMMLEQVQSGDPADYAEIALGKGEEWITSRLYIAAVMMERMRGLKFFVFVAQAGLTNRRFVAIAPISQIRWALAHKFPWLESAWLNAVNSAFPQLFSDPKMLAPTPALFQAKTGAFEPSQARQLVGNFIANLQRQSTAADNDYVTLKGQTQERSCYVTRAFLMSLLPAEAFHVQVDILSDAPRAKRTRAILRRHFPFVAVVDSNYEGELVRVINRHALLEEMATSVAEEPETG